MSEESNSRMTKGSEEQQEDLESTKPFDATAFQKKHAQEKVSESTDEIVVSLTDDGGESDALASGKSESIEDLESTKPMDDSYRHQSGDKGSGDNSTNSGSFNRTRVGLTHRKYISVTETNRNIRAAEEAATNDVYELKEMMARGAEAVLYRGVSGAFTYCVKSIRNNWSKVLGGGGASGGGEKLENVKYSTKLRHIQNEFEVSRKLNQDGPMPVVRMFALRRVTKMWKEVGYDLLMEYLDGHDLADKVLTRILPLEDKVRVLYQAAQALDYVHRKKIIHLDIKPSNFMLVNGKVKLIDFGVSVRNGYHSNAITGTGGYLSPEQICKDTIDEKTDVFAFGVAFSVFFGARPLTQPQEELMTRQARQEARIQLEGMDESLVREVPALQEMPEVADVLRLCTVPRRDKRIANCSQLLMMLQKRAEQYGITL